MNISHLCFSLQQARAEQEEEYISNKLLKKIQDLKKDKEKLVMNYEREEEYLTNDLSRKMMLVSEEFLGIILDVVYKQFYLNLLDVNFTRAFVIYSTFRLLRFFCHIFTNLNLSTSIRIGTVLNEK